MKRSDLSLMLEALRISKNALPDCLPNPPVGCLIYNSGSSVLLASGYTQKYGSRHAEVQALEQLAELDKQAIAGKLEMYVTLEPCAFIGKTPSCAKIIANSSVDYVHIGLIDPDPRNNGKGVALLRKAGIKTTIGLGRSEIYAFMKQFFKD